MTEINQSLKAPRSCTRKKNATPPMQARSFRITAEQHEFIKQLDNPSQLVRDFLDKAMQAAGVSL